ncbi:MAG: acetate kinase [Clostridia bacterium]|jgi:acetate kinase|nr:acetate kinase [Clostridia bacterium]
MKVLVLNSGSSSVKYQLFDMQQETVLAKGLVERIGLEGAVLNHQPGGGEKLSFQRDIPDHSVAIKMVLDALVNSEHGVLESIEEINAVGHRLVHGGNEFSNSVLIDEKVIETVKKLYDLAPLHNPPGIKGIEACQAALPEVPQVAVFDTAFHQTMPPYAYLYGLPYELYEKYAIRRYGFHGTSHKYVAQRGAELMGRSLSSLKIVTCHLGNGASITAVDGGRSVDTSMGFTPLEGLTMGTRCGIIDPAIVTFLMEKEGLDSDGLNELMNKKSGVLGISGVSSDFRDLEQKAREGHERSQLALDVFAYEVKKYIGAYAAALGGLDLVVFTAGLGENSPEMREAVCNGLEFLGITIDKDKNQVRGKETEISAEGSRVKVFVIPTNEELMIAKDTREIAADII